MDPNKCLEDLVAAYNAEDDSAHDLALDLESWINAGGFIPAQLHTYPYNTIYQVCLRLAKLVM